MISYSYTDIMRKLNLELSFRYFCVGVVFWLFLCISWGVLALPIHELVVLMAISSFNEVFAFGKNDGLSLKGLRSR